MVQPGQDCFAQRQVRARLIVIRRIRSKNSPQVRLTKDQQSVQAVPSQNFIHRRNLDDFRPKGAGNHYVFLGG